MVVVNNEEFSSMGDFISAVASRQGCSTGEVVAAVNAVGASAAEEYLENHKG